MNNQGQIFIFVVVAIVLVIGVLIIFLLRGPLEMRLTDESNPNAFIESCTREAVEEAVELLQEGGGDINPVGFFQFEDRPITYLCYNANYYESCITQRPLLIEHMQQEITDYITPKISDCFFNLESDLRRRYTVESGTLAIETILQPETIVVSIQKNLELSRENEVRTFEKFSMVANHPLYNLGEISMTIANQEAKYCDFDELGYMILYPQYDITKFVTGDATIVYQVTERNSDESFRFAVRSCALPEGY